MAEPYDTIAAGIADAIQRYRDAIITESQMAAEISPLLEDLSPTTPIQLSKVIQVLGRVEGQLFTDGLPADTLGTIGSTAVDLTNKMFYGPKTVDGWGVGTFYGTVFTGAAAAFFANPTSANLAALLSDETGSSFLVFRDSPTLVTPTLGVASATKIILTGGTSTAPALTFAGDLDTGMWSPTANTIAWSTGGSERMRIDASGGVGIGIAPSASYGLSVGANVFFASGVLDLGASGHRISYTGANLTISNGTTGTVAVQTGGASRLTIDNTGNVGIGTTAPALQSGGTGLHLNATSSSELKFTNNTTGALLTDGTALVSTGLDFTINNRETGSITLGTANSERMRINSSGNVGIGTTAPGSLLHLLGTNPRLTIESNGAGGPAVVIASENTAGTVAPNRFFIGQGSTPYLTISTVSSGGAGHVGIGTSAPANRLTVEHNAGGIFQQRITNTSTAGDARAAIEFVNDTAAQIGFVGAHGSQTGVGIGFPNALVFHSFNAAGIAQIASNAAGVWRVLTGGTSSTNERMRIDAAGNVGIGTTSPAFYTGYTTLAINHGTNGGVLDFLIAGTRHLTMYSGPSTSSLGTVSVTHLAFITGNTERMRLTAAGNFGIGTNDPSAGRLNVVGDQIVVSGSSGLGALGLQIKGAALSAIPAAQVHGYIATGDSSAGVAGDLLIAPRTTVTASVRFITGTTPAERMRIDATGNVGIGTAAPATTLHVNGTVTLQTGSGVLPIARGLTSAWFSSGENLTLESGSAANIIFNANGERVRITSAGNVGIGTTNPANFLLQVAGHIGPNATGASNLGSVANRFGSLFANAILCGGATGADSLYEFAGGNILLDNAYSLRSKSVAGVGFSLISVTSGNNVQINAPAVSGAIQLSAPSASGVIQFLNGGVERLRISADGNVGIGDATTGPPVNGTTLRIGKNLTGATNAQGAYNNQVVQSDVTSTAQLFSTFGSTAAAAFTLGSLVHYSAALNAIGAGSTVTNQIGFHAQATLVGATNNFGFYGAIAAGTGRWNFYALGTAPNYFEGNTGIGITVPLAKLDVNGNIRTSVGSGGTLALYDNDAVRNNRLIAGADASGAYFDTTFSNGGTAALLFRTIGTEHARINQAGNLAVGDTATLYDGLTSKVSVLSAKSGNSHGQMVLVDSASQTTGVGGSLGLVGRYNVAGSYALGARIAAQKTNSTADDYGFDLAFWTRPNAGALAQRMVIGSTGNVAIGTTNPASHKLIVVGGNTSTLRLDNAGEQYTSADWFNNGSNRASLYYDAIAAQFIVRTLIAADIGFDTNLTRKMTILSGGNVGIGTASPSIALQVESSTNSSNGFFVRNTNAGSSASCIISANSDSASVTLAAHSAASTAWADAATLTSGPTASGGLQITTATTAPIGFWTNSVERMRIDASGNVGIGTTSPSSRLDINGGQLRITASGAYSAAAINSGVLNYDSVNGDLVLAARSSGGNTTVSIRTSNAGTDSEKLRVRHDGNVGIGTTNPAARLVVTGGANGFEFLPGGTGSGSTFQVYDRAAVSYGAMNIDVASLTIRPGGSTAMAVTAAGNVGIGTASPGARLHVSAGNIRLTASSDGSNGVLQIQDTAVSTLLQIYNDSAKANIAVVEAKPMLFYTTNLERMRIDASGNVGIGTTNPTSPLEIGAGFIEVSNDGGLRSDISGTQRSLIHRTNTTELRIGDPGGWTFMSFWPGSGGNSVMQLTAGGNIGIRTTDQFGSGAGVIGLANAATAPTTNPTAGGVLFAEAGALKWRGSSGTITTIANA